MDAESERYIIVRQKGLQQDYADTKLLDTSSAIKSVDDSTRQNILKILHKEHLYPSQIAKRLKLNEQKVYYHVKQMHNAGLIKVVKREEIRGTVAKRYAAENLSFSIMLEEKWKKFKNLGTMPEQNRLQRFMNDLMQEGQFHAKIIVGSPDPHGPMKARARDGHYSAALAFALGMHMETKDFPVALDVDIDIKRAEENFIVVGGPITNLAVYEINQHMKCRFSETHAWSLTGINGKTYSDDTVGIINKMQNPFTKKGSIIVVAGTRFIGTKAAVLGITQHSEKIFAAYKGQKEWYSIVQGFDLDGDGKIDSVEVVE